MSKMRGAGFKSSLLLMGAALQGLASASEVGRIYHVSAGTGARATTLLVRQRPRIFPCSLHNSRSPTSIFLDITRSVHSRLCRR